jgi:hypothetical protein
VAEIWAVTMGGEKEKKRKDKKKEKGQGDSRNNE